MSDRSKIEWCDATWNVLSGCTKISAGCKNCYAAELHDRRHAAYLRGAKLPEQYAKPFSEIQLHPERLEMPLHWKKPRKIFVNSTSDLFHEDVPDKFIGRIWSRMLECPNHIFIVLTKRADRMCKVVNQLTDEGTRKGLRPADNIWLMVSVENQEAADLRIPYLLRTNATVRGVSGEPLLGPVDLEKHLIKRSWFRPLTGPINPTLSSPLTGDDKLMLNWVIVGGESGPNARPMHPDWARSLRDQCQAAGVPFFFKQWGEWAALEGFKPESDKPRYHRCGRKAAGRLLDGVEWNEYPETVKQS
ncbi:MAG: DUF5131 family protein [Bellilinea sp.]